MVALPLPDVTGFGLKTSDSVHPHKVHPCKNSSETPDPPAHAYFHVVVKDRRYCYRYHQYQVKDVPKEEPFCRTFK
jgi:hypothetical protein